MADPGGKAKGGLMSLLIPLIAVTVVGGGGGAFLGMSMLAPKEADKGKAAGEGVQSAEKSGEDSKGKARPAEKDAHGAPKTDAHGEAKSDAHADPHGGGHGDAQGDGHGKTDPHADPHGKAAEKKEELPPELHVKELPPLVTNLGGDKRNWVRLQSAIVYDAHETQHPDTLIPAIMSDITAFMSTVDVSAIEGADGLRRLQEELGERAATRSERQVKEFIIESLVVQ
jgi:flagellar basal body-associated protein FliL